MNEENQFTHLVVQRGATDRCAQPIQVVRSPHQQLDPSLRTEITNAQTEKRV